jgi:RND family efflux transporter MFP subunit
MNRTFHPRILAVLLASGALVGCTPGGNETPPASTSPGLVTATLVSPKRGEIWRSVTLPGNATPNQQAALYAKVGGYLKEIRVDKGDVVQQGDLLIKIEVPELIADQARLEAEHEAAKINYQRIMDAQAKSPDLVTRQSVDEGNGRYLAAKAARDRAQTLLGFCDVRAPFSGVITRRFVDPGAFIPAATTGSAAPGNPMVTVADFSIIRLQVGVPEQESSLIKNGLPVEATFEALPGQKFSAVISRSTHALDSGTKTLMIEIDLKNGDQKILPGMYAVAKIGLEKHVDALLIPSAAVLTEKNGASIFAVRNGKAAKVPVKTGFNDGQMTEILDAAVENETVAVRPSRALSDGDAVQPTPPQ